MSNHSSDSRENDNISSIPEMAQLDVSVNSENSSGYAQAYRVVQVSSPDNNTPRGEISGHDCNLPMARLHFPREPVGGHP